MPIRKRRIAGRCRFEAAKRVQLVNHFTVKPMQKDGPLTRGLNADWAICKMQTQDLNLGDLLQAYLSGKSYTR